MHFDLIYKLLQWLWHLLDDEIISMLEVTADFFDEISTDIEYVMSQIDPFLAEEAGSLPDFERFYKISVQSGATVADRRANVIARIRARGALNYPTFYSIAAALGYTVDSGTKYVTVVAGAHAAFRAGYGRAGIDAVWDQTVGSSMYDVYIRGTGVEEDTELQLLTNRLHLTGINLIFENV